jgi:hypothetical protein
LKSCMVLSSISGVSRATSTAISFTARGLRRGSKGSRRSRKARPTLCVS